MTWQRENREKNSILRFQLAIPKWCSVKLSNCDKWMGVEYGVQRMKPVEHLLWKVFVGWIFSWFLSLYGKLISQSWLNASNRTTKLLVYEIKIREWYVWSSNNNIYLEQKVAKLVLMATGNEEQYNWKMKQLVIKCDGRILWYYYDKLNYYDDCRWKLLLFISLISNGSGLFQL